MHEKAGKYLCEVRVFVWLTSHLMSQALVKYDGDQGMWTSLYLHEGSMRATFARVGN
jgi:hypothetical protein